MLMAYANSNPRKKNTMMASALIGVGPPTWNARGALLCANSDERTKIFAKCCSSVN